MEACGRRAGLTDHQPKGQEPSPEGAANLGETLDLDPSGNQATTKPHEQTPENPNKKGVWGSPEPIPESLALHPSFFPTRTQIFLTPAETAKHPAGPEKFSHVLEIAKGCPSLPEGCTCGQRSSPANEQREAPHAEARAGAVGPPAPRWTTCDASRGDSPKHARKRSRLFHVEHFSRPNEGNKQPDNLARRTRSLFYRIGFLLSFRMRCAAGRNVKLSRSYSLVAPAASLRGFS